ncbi:MAG: hypothetical protein RLY71_1983 [Pseudomonadota bacterium]|jgi:hypothetical protein
MSITTSDLHCITAQDVADFPEHLPAVFLELAPVLGTDAVLKLFNTCPGSQWRVPRPASNNKAGELQREKLAAVIGLEATRRLAEHMPCQMLNVPICKKLLNAKINRFVRARYDALTVGPTSQSWATAIVTICTELHALGRARTYRQIQTIINS